MRTPPWWRLPWKRPLGLRRSLTLVVLAAGTLLLGGQLLVQRYFIGYARRIYQANVDSMMERITTDLQGTFANMNSAVRHIADHPNVQEYVLSERTEDRFRRAFAFVSPIVQVATLNLGFDHVLISDISGSWYRFYGNLSNAACQRLAEEFGESWDIANKVLDLDGGTYFCTGKPIVVIQGYRPLRAGLAVALTDVGRTRKAFSGHPGYEGFAISLHDSTRVIVSNVAAAEGGVPGGPALARERMYTRSGTVIPDSLWLSIGIPQRLIFPQQTAIALTFVGVGVFSLLLLLMLAVFVNRFAVRPIEQVIEGTGRLDEGNPRLRLEPTGVEYVDTLVAEINGMLQRLEDYNRRALSTQMHLLKNQINRHFLYNSLSSIKALADRGEVEKAGEVSGGIAQLLRYSTSPEEEVNLFDEMDIVQRYVRIQNIRFAGKFRLETEVDDRLCEYRILKLLIQPLVENSLIHGLEGAPSGSELRVSGSLRDGGIEIVVEDRGIGIPAAKLEEIQRNIDEVARGSDVMEGVEGIALVNIQKRISLAYGRHPGGPYGLRIESGEGCFTRATLRLPALPESAPGGQIPQGQIPQGQTPHTPV